MAPKKVTLIVDRESRCHADFWTSILEELNRDKQFESVVTRVPLADWLTRPLEQQVSLPWEVIEQSTDILIINWDAVNGDPDFGGDVALRWFEHRQFALRRWLNDGGLLILDGQAAQGVPDDRYYSAVLGDDEVRLSGREDPTNPDKELLRLSGAARMTRLARQAPKFDNLKHVTPRKDRSFEDLYPPEAVGKLVPRYLNEIDMTQLLYRGWFRRRIPGRTLRWTPYVRRAERWPRNFPTLLAAKCGARGGERGIVFATTMLLAATGQLPLIRAMLCTHGRVDKLPDIGPVRRTVSRLAPKAACSSICLLWATVLQEWSSPCSSASA
jgi:hypothetical protein